MALLLLGTPAAHALSTDRAQPIDLSADHIRLDQRTGVTTYYGHVVLRQGSLEVRADKAVVEYRKNAISTITAFGAPLHFQEQPTRTAAKVLGSARLLTYVASSHVLQLQHQVVLRQGPNSFKSASMRYNLLTQVVHASGNEQHKRVHATLIPSTRKPVAPAHE
ncbi:MAG TPA: lipopolysaccharide transport periplasmic protein LptA [Acidiferrobacteraceae bacterium]|nr:lipopolysaccharide transport periplasmic protein LptA [Acidiferrobacteraceae bacterium]